jgi:hypothetical protein
MECGSLGLHNAENTVPLAATPALPGATLCRDPSGELTLTAFNLWLGPDDTLPGRPVGLATYPRGFGRPGYRRGGARFAIARQAVVFLPIAVPADPVSFSARAPTTAFRRPVSKWAYG